MTLASLRRRAAHALWFLLLIPWFLHCTLSLVLRALAIPAWVSKQGERVWEFPFRKLDEWSR